MNHRAGPGVILWLAALAIWLAVVTGNVLVPQPAVLRQGEYVPPAIVPAAEMGGSSTVEPGSYKSVTMGPTPSRPTTTPAATSSPTAIVTQNGCHWSDYHGYAYVECGFDNAERPIFTPTAIRGEATWYGGPVFAGKRMANGDLYNEWDPTTACNTCDLGEILTVTYSKTITVTVTDTGNFTHELDLSRGAFMALVGSTEAGIIPVEIRRAVR